MKMNKRRTNNKQTWRVMAKANSTKIKKSSQHNVDCCVLIHFLRSRVLTLFVVLVVVRRPCCHVLVVVCCPSPLLLNIVLLLAQHSVLLLLQFLTIPFLPIPPLQFCFDGLSRKESLARSPSRGVSRGESLARSLLQEVSWEESLAGSVSCEESLPRSLLQGVFPGSLSRGVSCGVCLSQGV